jgi:hypothetical protein
LIHYGLEFKYTECVHGCQHKKYNFVEAGFISPGQYRPSKNDKSVQIFESAYCLLISSIWSISVAVETPAL